MRKKEASKPAVKLSKRIGLFFKAQWKNILFALFSAIVAYFAFSL